MDKGTKIALAVLVFASAGIGILLVMPEEKKADSTVVQAPATVDPADCAAVAAAAAQQYQTASGDSTSVVGAHFSPSQKTCYYELTVFAAEGTRTIIKSAPGDQTIALCTVSPTNNLTCQKGDGSTITQPQFKALLSTYLGG